MNENELRKLRAVECSIQWLITQYNNKIKPLEKYKGQHRQRERDGLEGERHCCCQCLGVLQEEFKELLEVNASEPMVQDKSMEVCQQMVLEI